MEVRTLNLLKYTNSNRLSERYVFKFAKYNIAEWVL